MTEVPEVPVSGWPAPQDSERLAGAGSPPPSRAAPRDEERSVPALGRVPGPTDTAGTPEDRGDPCEPGRAPRTPREGEKPERGARKETAFIINDRCLRLLINEKKRALAVSKRSF